MLALGIYWCYEVYQSWTDQPVITTITSAGVNFINILCKLFSYKRALLSFSLITVWLCDFLAKEYQRKSC